jgi:hypothetical protein
MEKAWLKYLIFTVSALFLFGSTSLPFHHHNFPLQLVSCAICKAKTSTASAQSKPNIDWDFTNLSEPSQITLHLVCYGLIALLSISATHSIGPNRRVALRMRRMTLMSTAVVRHNQTKKGKDGHQ